MRPRSASPRHRRRTRSGARPAERRGRLALPVRRRPRDVAHSRWRAAPTGSSAARRPGSAPARTTAFASRGRSIRRAAIASTPRSCSPTPTPTPSTGRSVSTPRCSRFGEDSGPHAPKAIAGAPPAGEPGRRRIAPEALVIYELNLRGFSRLNPAIPEAVRGTFAGLAHPASIAHLAGLGVTAVEIMPADAFVDERHLAPLGLANAWGYNPVVFGAPDPRLAPGGWAEVRAATDALHAAGMEAILDVVFNHNGESDAFGPTLSFRGLDNATFFRLDPGQSGSVRQRRGHRELRRARPPAGRRDGDRRAPALDGPRRNRRLPVRSGDRARARPRRFRPRMRRSSRRWPRTRSSSKARLIAEPWDIGPGGYQLGRFGPAWAEWNDHFRDAARRFWRGDAGLRGEIATRLAGSRDVFADAAAPSKSVNFIVAHDGFTLADLVSYDRKHNEANGEQNRDGTDANYSWNHGVEGPSADPAIVAARARDQRNLLTLLFAARGTPMLAMGAELGFSQGGNNNAYAQDNASTAIDWASADAGLVAFREPSRRACAARIPPCRATPFSPGGRSTRPAFPTSNGATPRGRCRSAAGTIRPGRFSSPSSPRPHAGGIDRVAVAMNRSNADVELRLPDAARRAWRGGRSSTPTPPTRPSVRSRSPTAAGSRRAPRLILAEGPAPKGLSGGPPSARTIDALAERGRARRRLVGPRRQADHRLARKQDRPSRTRSASPAASEADARDSLTSVLDETRRRRVPPSACSCGRARSRSRRCATRRAPARRASNAKTAASSNGGRLPATASRARSPTAGRVVERTIALPELPIGRHRLIVDGVDCALTVAPPECYGREGALGQAVRRDRPALRFAARGRSGDRRLRGAGAGRRGGRRRGRGLSRRQPDAHAVPARPRAGEPLLSVGPTLPRSDPDRRLRRRPAARPSRRGGARGARARGRDDLGGAARRLSGGLADQARRARSAARRVRPRSPRRGPARRSSPTTAPSSPRAARRCGGLPPSRRSPPAKRARTGASGRKRFARATRRPSRRRSTRTRRAFDFALFCQWLADRQLARAAERARAKRARNRLLSGSRGRLRARRRRSLGAWRGADARRDGRRAARSVLDQGPELEPACAEPARGRAAGLDSPQRALRRQHAPRRDAAHRPRHGPAAPLPHPGGRDPGRRRLPLLSARRSHRPHRAREPARANAWWSARTSAPSPRGSAAA